MIPAYVIEDESVVGPKVMTDGDMLPCRKAVRDPIVKSSTNI
jgi:hypothetical protein